MQPCELVIFDCDGTLMDSEMLAAEVEVEMLQEYGAQLTPKEFSSRFAGTSSQFVKTAMEEELGRALPDDHADKVSQKMNERLWRDVKAMPGAIEVLDMFDQPRCVCSNAGLDKLKIELSKGELWDRFRPYVFSAKDIDGVERKPAPDIFLHAAQEFGAAPEACFVVEDSNPGILAAKAAGMRAIGFTGGCHTHPGHADELTDAGAETVIRKLTDLPGVITALEKWSPNSV